MKYSFFPIILLISVLVLSWCLGNTEPVGTTDTTEPTTWDVQESIIVMTGDAQSWTISDEEVDAILWEIFEAIEGWLATPETTGATEPLLESNDVMPHDDVLMPEKVPQAVPQDWSLQQ